MGHRLRWYIHPLRPTITTTVGWEKTTNLTRAIAPICAAAPDRGEASTTLTMRSAAGIYDELLVYVLKCFAETTAVVYIEIEIFLELGHHTLSPSSTPGFLCCPLRMRLLRYSSSCEASPFPLPSTLVPRRGRKLWSSFHRKTRGEM